MIYYTSEKVKQEFHQNLVDWHLGGPKSNGWTRTGPPLPLRVAKLTSYHLGEISVDDGLAKNKEETLKWHLAFLQGDDSLYLSEYLKPRYNESQIAKRIRSFRQLLTDIQSNGIRKPIWVADISCLDLDFRYFRFNGCHRLCCAKILGIQLVPAFIFKTSTI